MLYNYLKWRKVPQNVTKWGIIAMLTGKYEHSVDSKNRLIIPAKIKEQLGAEITILQIGPKCLTVYSKEEWEKYCENISNRTRSEVKDISRYIFSKALTTVLDAQGRVVIPQSMLDYAHITKNVVTVGCGKYAEIWSEESWIENDYDSEPENLEEILEELGL